MLSFAEVTNGYVIWEYVDVGLKLFLSKGVRLRKKYKNSHWNEDKKRNDVNAKFNFAKKL